MLNEITTARMIIVLTAAGIFLSFGLDREKVIALETTTDKDAGQMAPSQPSDVATLYQEGVDFFKKGEYEKALMKFRQVRMRDPDYGAADAFLKRIDEQLAFQERKTAVKQKHLEDLKRQAESQEAQKRREIEQRLIGEKKRQEAEVRRQDNQARWQAAREEKQRLASLQREQKRAQLEERRAEQKVRREQTAQQKDLARLVALEKKESRRQPPSTTTDNQVLKLNPEPVPPQALNVTATNIREAGTPAESQVVRQEAVHGPKDDRYQKERQQRAVMKQAQSAYREAVASYKINHHLHARDQIEELRTLLTSEILPDDFRQRMSQKADLAQHELEEREARLCDLRQQEFSKKATVSASPQAEPSDLLEKAAVFASQVRNDKAVETNLKPERAATASQELPETTENAIRPIPVLRRERSRISESSLGKGIDPDPVGQHERADKIREKEALEKKFLSGIDELYQDGLELYEKGIWDMARDVLFEVDRLVPDYKMTKHYLSVIESRLEKGPQKAALSPSPGLEDAGRQMVIEQSLDDMSNANPKGAHHE